MERQLELFEQEPDKQIMGPFPSGEVGTIAGKSRCSICIPFELVPLVLGKELDARTVCETLFPVMTAKGMENECTELIRFLIMASTQPTNTTMVPRTVQSHAGHDNVTVRPVITRHRREKVLCQDSLAIKPGSAPRGDPEVCRAADGLPRS